MISAQIENYIVSHLETIDSRLKRSFASASHSGATRTDASPADRSLWRRTGPSHEAHTWPKDTTQRVCTLGPISSHPILIPAPYLERLLLGHRFGLLIRKPHQAYPLCKQTSSGATWMRRHAGRNPFCRCGKCLRFVFQLTRSNRLIARKRR